MAPRRGKSAARPRIPPEARALIKDVARLVEAGHIPHGTLAAWLSTKSPAEVHAEADRLCGPAPGRKTAGRKRAPKRPRAEGSFEFEVSVVGIKPRIWRRSTIKSSETFLDLHEAIQDAGGWWNYHQFLFEDARTRKPIASLPTSGEPDLAPFAGDVRLDWIIPPDGQAKLRYVYDFGDNWELDVVVRAFIPEPSPMQRRLLDGARAFPHEDSGGDGGYEDCLEALAATEPTQDQLERRTWLGDWTREAFDLEAGRKKFDRKKRERTGDYVEEF